MPQEILNIILSAAGTVLTALFSWAVGLLISWLNTKIKDKKVAGWVTSITTIITGAVQSVFQTFVETLKENGKFDEKAQQEAKERALDIIMNELTPELKDYITKNFGDMKEWISQQIEAIIYQLKQKNKAE